MMKLKVNWYIANQLQANFHQKSTIWELLRRNPDKHMVSDINDVKDGVHKRGKKANTSSKLASKTVSEHFLVDLILLEASSCSKYSKTGES